MSQTRTAPRSPDDPGATPALHDRAIDNLTFIRQAMERAGSFTAVSGTGIVAIGLLAVPTAFVAARMQTASSWVWTWVAAAAMAVVIELTLTARKARESGMPMMSGPGQKFALAFTPPLLAGAILTMALTTGVSRELLVGMWLLLYGAGVTAGGALSVPVIPVMGVAFMASGVVALMLPATAANWMMLAGFGGLHVVFGFYIARRYGG